MESSERSRLRVAMIGTGRWASVLALDVAQTPGAELVACFDTDREAAKRFASDFGCRRARDIDEIALDAEVDAGVACVPNSAHRDVALALAAGGKHVFVPRPIASSVRPAREMVAAAERGGVVLFIDHSSSFRPEMDAMFDAAFDRGSDAASRLPDTEKATAPATPAHALEPGRAGRLFGGHALRSAHWEAAEGASGWHFSPRECPGGPATLLGVSAAATLIRFLGEPVAVRGSVAAGLVRTRVPNVATFLIEHESGAHSTLVASGVSAVPNDLYYFYGMTGVIMYGPTASRAGARALIAEEGSRVLTELDAPARPRRGIEMFVEQVQSGREPPASVRLALTALATVEAGLRSVAEDRRVTLREVLAD